VGPLDLEPKIVNPLRQHSSKERKYDRKKVAVVTGVGPGLGASLARRFAESYAVAIIARKADYLKGLAGEIRGSGATVLDLTCDVGDRMQVTEAFCKIRAELGEPEVLLYNAGSGTFGTITDITPDQYEADWRVNALGAFLAAREVVPGMIALAAVAQCSSPELPQG
jgi:NAD(P)-dependent dehydrogenase (short-subunit alcohol dehydrogenase family)